MSIKANINRFSFALLRPAFITMLPNAVLAQAVSDVFGEVETKGNMLVDWFTGGFFAFAIVALSLLFVIVSFLQGRMEWTRALTIVLASILIGQVPNIANWLIH